MQAATRKAPRPLRRVINFASIFAVQGSSKTITIIVVLLLFLWLTELHSVLHHWLPKRLNQPLDHFLEPGFHRKDISLQWWVKTFFDDIFVVVGFNVAAANSRNQKLAIVFRWISIYYLFDIFFFWWNYKHWPVEFYGLLCVTSVIMLLLIVKRRQNNTLIVEFEDYEKTTD